ncbi:MAG: Dabb family protein, partial [Cyanobacteriota bacterium]|nr:Dabb family protein [Cyanobacteriota bacterium]
MIVHVVLFKWKEDVTSDAITTAVEALQALKAKIPGILEITCGRNFSERSQGFHQGLVVKFADKAA